MKDYKTWVLGMGIALLFSGAWNCALRGQAITGDILGTVRDVSGAVVPGATVVLTQTTTGVKWSATTDAGGNYLFAQLKPDRYGVRVAKAGFESTTVSDIDLLLGQRPQVDVLLRVGQVTETVTVNAGGVQLLESQTSSAGMVIQQRPIVQLPLNGRDFMQLTVLVPTVAPILSGNSPATSWTGLGSGGASTSVAGMRESNVSYLLDGIETRNARFGSEDLHPSIDALQEFKMQTDAFSSEFGRSSAVVNMAIKAGTNQFHGDAFEFIRNSALDANDFFFNTQGLAIPHYAQNDFGATLGGPIRHDKAFFFLSYEGFRSRTGATGEALVASPGQWAGDLADNSAGTGIFPTNSSFCQANPGSSRCMNVLNPSTGQPFPGNVIHTSILDQRAQKWRAFSPTPNVPGAVNSSTIPLFNYAASPTIRNDFNDATVRIDESLSSKDQVFGSYTFHDVPHIVPSVMPLAGQSYPLRSQVASLTENHIFSPTIVNEARFGYNRGKTFLVSQGALGPNYAASDFGFTNTSENPFDFGVPDAGIPGFTTIGSSAESIGSIDQDFQAVDNLSIVHHNHNLKTGVDIMRERFFQITDFSGIPGFSFTGQFSGSSLADMLLGVPFSGSTAVGNSAQDLRTTYWGVYLQDDWRLRPNLTFNLGIRYEYSSPPADKYDRTAWFNPATQQVEYSDLHQVRNGVINPDYTNVSPRLGFAYTPGFSKNTVLRGAFGSFYATDNWNELQFLVNAPRYYSTQSLTSNPVTPTLSLENVFPPPSVAGGTAFPFTLDNMNRTPYVLEWNFDAQHLFGNNWLADVAYVGNRGDELPQRRNEDIASFDPTGTIPLAQREPYPALSGILLGYNGGWSSYNALAARIEKRTSAGLYLLASYTYSKCLDIGNTDDFSMVSSDYNIYDKGNCDYNTPQRLAFSYTYQLPFGRGAQFFGHASGLAGKLVSGWEVTGITTFSSGQYMTVSLPGNWMNIGSFSTAVPDKIGPAYPSNRTLNDWLNITSFAYPGCPSYTICATGLHIEGDAGRNQIERPGINNWDMGLVKETRINERFSTQFRAEFFNAWNHAQFGTPSSSLIAGQFGRISSLLIPPREIQFALKVVF
ncbi:MAG: carboxypeptidase regulatory-like domain-containing protein [Terriglobia bacterium]